MTRAEWRKRAGERLLGPGGTFEGWLNRQMVTVLRGVGPPVHFYGVDPGASEGDRSVEVEVVRRVEDEP
jgi:hypothetical protein